MVHRRLRSCNVTKQRETPRANHIRGAQPVWLRTSALVTWSMHSQNAPLTPLVKRVVTGSNNEFSIIFL